MTPSRLVRPRRKRPVIALDPGTARRRPSPRRGGTARHFEIDGVEGVLITNSYPDGTLGELWARIGAGADPLAGLLDGLLAGVSTGLQHGVPLESYVRRYVGTRFDPAGPVSDPDLDRCTSVLDYVFRRVALDHLDPADRTALGVLTTDELRYRAERG
ncbi:MULTISPECIES: hypothetical protein [Saccharopolyspora]|uniref:ribonucleoside-diphosphate reductase n=1 Tax=Saccharopolyspora cebuensis TaxID=418759 RepID=A0ABV4CCW9_9PSEU